MRLRWAAPVYFTGAFAVLVALSVWLQSNGYINSSGVQRWAEAVTVMDATEDVAQALTRSFPWLSFVGLAVFRAITGQLPVWVPVAMSNFAGAAVLTVFFISLTRRRKALSERLFLPLLVLVHPLFLWPVTSGDSQALQLVLFLGLTRAAIRVAGDIDARALMTMAGFCCLLLFADGRSVYILLGLFLLIPFLLPNHNERDGAIGGYMIVFLPLAMALAGCAYVGWVATGDPLLLYNTALGHNAPREAGERWFAYAPGLLGSLVVIPALAWACFPMAGPVLRQWTSPHRATTTIAGAAAVAAVVAHADSALPHPATMLFYGIVPWICFLVLVARRALLTAAAGTLAAWLVFTWLPTADMQSWTLALRGGQLPVSSPATAQLGHWLTKQQGEIIADDRLLAPALAVRGHARNMLLPGNASFRLAMRADVPTSEWVVMRHPSAPAYAVDRVASRYQQGLPGYELAWQNDEWQVFHHTGSAADLSRAARHTHRHAITARIRREHQHRP